MEGKRVKKDYLVFTPGSDDAFRVHGADEVKIGQGYVIFAADGEPIFTFVQANIVGFREA